MSERQSVHTFETRDGLTVRLRPIRADDHPRLLDIYAHLSARSRLMRFNLDTTRYDEARIVEGARRIATVEPTRGVAWLALVDIPGAPEQPVGGVQLLFVPPDGAEVAIIVRDDMQRRGIARGMVAFLFEVAPQLGVRFLFGVIRADNAPLLALLKALPIPAQLRDNGETLYLEVDLHAPGQHPPDRT